MINEKHYLRKQYEIELKSKYGEVVEKIWNRHCKSEFKRKKAPIFIERKLYM